MKKITIAIQHAEGVVERLEVHAKEFRIREKSLAQYATSFGETGNVRVEIQPEIEFEVEGWLADRLIETTRVDE
jgi:hypothetical protein